MSSFGSLSSWSLLGERGRSLETSGDFFSGLGPSSPDSLPDEEDERPLISRSCSRLRFPQFPQISSRVFKFFRTFSSSQLLDFSTQGKKKYHNKQQTAVFFPAKIQTLLHEKRRRPTEPRTPRNLKTLAWHWAFVERKSKTQNEIGLPLNQALSYLRQDEPSKSRLFS